MIIVFIIIAVVGIALFYRKTIPELDSRRKSLLVILRIIAVACVLILLFNPVLYFSELLKTEPEILVLNDVSGSMTDKADQMNSLRENILKKCKSHKIVSHNFADGLSGTKLSTNLSKTLMELADKMKNVKAILLFSDGWFKDSNLSFAENLSVPVYAFAPEIIITDPDLETSAVHHTQTAFKDEITAISADVYSRDFVGSAEVQLYINEKLIEKKNIQLLLNELKQVEFEYTFKTSGLHNIQVKIISKNLNETDIENNSASSVIRVLDNRNKILLITDKANWDTKFLSSALRNNPGLQTEILLKSGTLKNGNKRTTLPKEMQNVSVLILVNTGKLRFSVSESEIITRFVQNGGGLLVQGKQSLKNLLPAKSTEIVSQIPTTLRFTEKSKQYETFSTFRNASGKMIPPVDYFFTEPNLQSTVFATFDNDDQTPAILFQEFSAGKVMYFPFLNLWRWQMRDKNYSVFISDLVQWLSTTSSDRFFATSTKNSFKIGEDVVLELTAYDEKLIPVSNLNAKIVVRDSKDKIVYNEYMISGNEKYRAVINELQADKYTFLVSDETTKQQANGEFTVSSDNPEKYDKGINKTLLSYIANRTNGGFFSDQEIDEFVLPQANVTTKELKKEIPIYRKWYLIAVFLLSFCTELFFRKRWGLL